MAEVTSTDNKKVEIKSPLVLESRSIPPAQILVESGEILDLTTTVYETPRKKTTIFKWWKVVDGVVYQRIKSFEQNR